MKSRFSQFQLVAFLVILALALAACVAPAPTPTPSKPAIKIDAPASNTQVNVGQDVAIQSTSTDAKGIVRVELLVDGNVIAGSDAPGAQASFTVLQAWKAAGPGSHTLSVRAINKDNVASEPAAVTIVVAGAPAPTATGAATIAPTKAPATVAPTAAGPTATVAPTKPAATATPIPPTAVPTAVPCQGAALFVDETIPDGTTFLPNQQFSKTWRVRNSGNCPWTGAYQLVHIGGERMVAAAAFAVPATAVGGYASLAIPMTAPGQPGQYAGQWRLRDDKGVLFGPALSISIRVVSPQPTACVPVISSFGADRTTINRGESVRLVWGAVTSAERVEIDNGIGGVGTPGDRVVAPNQTTTFTLVAYCGANSRSAQVTINVIQPAPTQPPVTRRNINGGWAAGNYHLQLSEADGCGGPVCGVSGDYSEWTGGTPVTAQVNGTVNVNTGAVSLNIVQDMPGAPSKTFNGTLSANSSQLSGSLSGVGQLTFTRE